MNINLTRDELRLLLDLAYAGNWVLNSTRGDDRLAPYDGLVSKLFGEALRVNMPELIEIQDAGVVPSQAYRDGGIHEAIMDYEDSMFFEILAEELARRDMNHVPISGENFHELSGRIEEYIEEFEQNGMDNLTIN